MQVRNKPVMRFNCNWHVAFGKAKGKGKFGQKGKPGNGKLVRSHLTIEQRHAKLADWKKGSRCMRCGAIGHWAGDPACKFLDQEAQMLRRAVR